MAARPIGAYSMAILVKIQFSALWDQLLIFDAVDSNQAKL